MLSPGKYVSVDPRVSGLASEPGRDVVWIHEGLMYRLVKVGTGDKEWAGELPCPPVKGAK